ncbi:synaptotagmin-4-like [Oppia nitens]|uniref:synaptotagmin-4-like n=1 Tax=Oppia nitens TaxID=1686743 RepID=UPI0023DC50CF|nr:synaptotagmin-4-like [Oppia nitens]
MFKLNEDEKVFIVIIASSLFLLSLIITICLVTPVCWLNKWLIKNNSKKQKDDDMISQYIPNQLLTHESKHFQLSIVPNYGVNSQESVAKHITKVSHDFFVNQTTIRKQSIGSESESIKQKTGVIKFGIRYEITSTTSLRLIINIIEICELQPREYLADPSCYVSIILIGLKARRRSLIHRATPSVLYRTASAKRCLNPVFNELFVSQDLPKSILNNGIIKLKIFDDERYANDVCLGQTSLQLKQLLANPLDNNMTRELTLLSCKESKGEILVGLCYLPTAKRLTIAVMKATLSHAHQIHTSAILCYYIRVLLFINGKLIKKKKTSFTQKMIWSDNEIMTFDLMSLESQQPAIMFVLSYKQESSQSSPSSPETPVSIETNGSHKDRHIGQFVVGNGLWQQMRQQPREQIVKWHKLC